MPKIVMFASSDPAPDGAVLEANSGENDSTQLCVNLGIGLNTPVKNPLVLAPPAIVIVTVLARPGCRKAQEQEDRHAGQSPGTVEAV